MLKDKNIPRLRLRARIVWTSRTAAFTLIEVLIASVIMAITVAAVGIVLRTGSRAWRVGHGVSEIFQMARIAQDVISRDLNNMVYLEEKQYNRQFEGSLMAEAGLAANNPDLIELNNIAPPIDLSFRGTDGGQTDQLTFARGYQVRYSGDPNTWGLRRVTYFVRDKTLYRREDDPYGLSPSMAAHLDQPPPYGAQLNEQQIMAQEVKRMFINQGESMSGEGASEEAGARDFLPTQLRVEEPLSGGVETFDIVYGYFKEGEWIQPAAQDWDSHARKYRNPPTDEELMAQEAQALGRMPMQQGGDPMAMIRNAMKIPDNLPGYISIQLGVREPGNAKGRLYSFTFYHSLPIGQETDILPKDPMAMGLRN